MTVDNLPELILIRSITGCRHSGGVNQLVRDATQCGHHHDNRFIDCFYNSLDAKILFTEPTDVPPNFITFISLYIVEMVDTMCRKQADTACIDFN